MCWNELSIVYFLNHSSGNQCSVVVFGCFFCKYKNLVRFDFVIVKLRERERHRVDQGKKRKKWMVDGGYPFPDA